MSNIFYASLAAIGLSLIGVAGDYFLKLASSEARPIMSQWFIVGFIVYSSTTFGWVFVMRHLKLASIGVIYGTSTVLFLVFAGLTFGERLTPIEVVGVCLAVASLLLLRRFA